MATPAPLTSSHVSAPVFANVSPAVVAAVKTVVTVVGGTVVVASEPDCAPATPEKPNRMAKAAAASPAPVAEINLRT